MYTSKPTPFLSSLADKQLVLASDEIHTRLRCGEAPAPASADPSAASCVPSSPPTEGRRPQFRRKRDKKRPRRPLLGEPDKEPASRGSSKGINAVIIRRKSRNPGLRQELSPKCLYSRPPEEDNETGAGNQGDQGGVESDGTSNNGSRYFELFV